MCVTSKDEIVSRSYQEIDWCEDCGSEKTLSELSANKGICDNCRLAHDVRLKASKSRKEFV